MQQYGQQGHQDKQQQDHAGGQQHIVAVGVPHGAGFLKEYGVGRQRGEPGPGFEQLRVIHHQPGAGSGDRDMPGASGSDGSGDQIGYLPSPLVDGDQVTAEHSAVEAVIDQ